MLTSGGLDLGRQNRASVLTPALRRLLYRQRTEHDLTKDANIMLRVDAEAKRRITAAARASDKSITAFITETTMNAVVKAERKRSRRPKRELRGACPSFFRACCATAQAGGQNSYRCAAYELTRALSELSPWELSAAEWTERLKELAEVLESDSSDAGILRWFEENVPRCLALVPRRRRGSFVQGVQQYVEDHGVEFL